MGILAASYSLVDIMVANGLVFWIPPVGFFACMAFLIPFVALHLYRLEREKVELERQVGRCCVALMSPCDDEPDTVRSV